MPILKDYRGVIETTLPQSGAKVTLYDGFLTEHIDQIQKMGGQPAASKIMAMIIKSWDFTDENQQPVPVDEKATRKLHMVDVMHIVKESKLQDFLGDVSGSVGS